MNHLDLQSPSTPLAQLPQRLSIAPPVAADEYVHCPCARSQVAWHSCRLCVCLPRRQPITQLGVCHSTTRRKKVAQHALSCIAVYLKIFLVNQVLFP
jgi:hypothetical protein